MPVTLGCWIPCRRCQIPDSPGVFRTLRRLCHGPSLIECQTYRWEGHSVFPRPDPRPSEEVESWKQRDPIEQARGILLENELLDSSSDEELVAGIRALMDEAETFAAESPMPEASEAFKDIYV